MKPDKETLRRLYEDEKLTGKQIAKMLNSSQPTVSKWLIDYGIRTRSISEARKLLFDPMPKCCDCSTTLKVRGAERCRRCNNANRSLHKLDPQREIVGSVCSHDGCSNPLRVRRTRYCSHRCRALASESARKQRDPLRGTRQYVAKRKKYWTATMENYVRRHYASSGGKLVAEALGLTRIQVKQKAYSMGLRVTEKRKEQDTKERLARLDACRLAMQKTQPSKLEQKLWAILDDLGVEYVTQYRVGDRFFVDVKADDLIIQVDGEYWHGHPDFEPLTPKQVTQVKRDAAQDKYARACGFTVVRIWGKDVTPTHVKMLVENHCSRKCKLFA